ncbi:hypothetical protein [Pseudomonas sp. R62]|uniref:hypothetical protein n=1 Tax=Pseudomonas sp. R62 TaxID=1144884 RepID=UPI001EE6518B|nr:hypothetical protein [Pseudomonas sp. R62]
MDVPQLLVDLMILQRHRQLHACQASCAIEQLVQRHPEIQPRIDFRLKVHRPEALRITAQLHGNVSAVAHRHDPDAMYVAVDKGQEASLSGVISGRRGADPSNAGARKAQVGVSAVHGVGCAAIFTGKSHHRQGRASGSQAQLIEGGRCDAVNIIQNAFDFARSRKQPQIRSGFIDGHLR